MKKGLIITIATLCVIGLGAAGVFVAASRGLFAHNEANGLILYGSDQQLGGDKKTEADNTEYVYQTNVKIVEDNLMIIREADMNEFCKVGIVNFINEKEECEPVTEIASAQNTPLYYAKKTKSSITVAGKVMNVIAGKDYIIGNGRMFAEGYLVVSDSAYKDIQEEETGMMVMKLNKAADQEIGRCQYKLVQLIDIP